MTANPQEPRAAHATTAGPASAGQNLRELFGSSSAVFASMLGAEHVLESANAAFFATTGHERARTGLPVAQCLPELAEQGFVALMDEVYRTGQAYTGRDVRVVLGAGVRAQEAFFDFTYEPRRGLDGAVIGIQLIGVETTQVRHAQQLMLEHQSLLEQIARQAPLTEVLDGMARCIEGLTAQGVLVSVLLADPDGTHLRHGTAPSLPAFYNEAIDGIATGEGIGSCGTAAHRREPVVVTDIANDPFWVDFRDVAGRAGLAACWSTPILARDGSLLGTFAMYHRVPRAPQDSDLALARVFTGTAALAIERHRIELGKAVAEASAAAAHRALTEAVEAEQKLRAEAEERASAAAALGGQMRDAAAAQAGLSRPGSCQLGARVGCTAPVELKITDSWGDAAWGCFIHAEEALFNVRTAYIAEEQTDGLAAYLNR
ncbi:GAF domain-containing protein [Kineosporia succinea]|uniref:GAF domain-containing protein n=1 Tax=Kineosporia succinea TaxID=84632 RepID=A0ABT9PAP4_9ACTN|nr:GAF domain-containing protein [Kineosporia succinea]MDP9829484.1 GAF domain-containing protein [Kineosporia succinea]